MKMNRSTLKVNKVLATVCCAILILQIIEGSNVKNVLVPPNQEKLDVEVSGNSNRSPKLVVVCYPGVKRTWYRLWLNPQLYMIGDDVHEHQIFYGSNQSDVESQSQAPSLIYWPGLSETLTGKHAFLPFNTSCIGVSSSSNYTIKFIVKNPEWRFVVYTAVGVLLFHFAALLSRNVALHYSAGISVGVLGSLLIVLFILNRFMPQTLKRISYAVFAVSASLSMFLMRFMYGQIEETVFNYWKFLLGYIAVAGLLSFALMYRYGPVTDPRSLDLIKWLLQGLGLTLIYQGSQIPEMAVAAIAINLTIYLFPRSLLSYFSGVRYEETRISTHTQVSEDEDFQDAISEEEYYQLRNRFFRSKRGHSSYNNRKPSKNTY